MAFEGAETFEAAASSVKRLQKRLDIQYPIAIAQYGSIDKNTAAKKLPMLNHVLSYPTTIFLDKLGKVKKIHTGFSGPATGEKYVKFVNEFNATVHELIK